MFPSTTIKFSNSFNDIGLLCESLLFYKEVNVILDYMSLPGLFTQCGLENISYLCRRNRLKLYYNEHSLGAGYKPDINAFIVSTFESDGYTLNKGVSNAIDITQERGIQAANAKRYFLRTIKKHRYDGGFNTMLHDELNDAQNIISAVQVVTKNSTVISSDNINITKLINGFYRIECDIDAEIIRDGCKLIASSTGLLYDGERYNSALATNFSTSNYMEYKVNRSIELAFEDSSGIKNFHEIVLPYSLDIANTMNEGGKNFGDFLKLLNEAEKFKEWLADEEPTQELIEAYLQKINESTFLKTKTGKVLRWILFTGTGLALGGEIGGTLGTAASTAIDGFDDLLLDRLIGKYKPNQFVNGEYIDYLSLRI